ncbi:unnamed protein product [Rotaria socialis]|uniref:Uncharacterized protein n=1 Tax=Rotaria socialis TaxID=392032 RepID=A0A820NZF0_9BILA|nr:unnamed protein product [Rotaria socialis]CAF4395152.1 unnamed protein product [Rotaria socialis]
MTETLIGIPVASVPNTNTSNGIGTEDEETLKYISSGRSYARNGNYSDAITNLKHATHLQPSNSEAFYYLGLVYLEKRQYGDAIEALKAAIQNSNTDNKENTNHYYFKYAFACQNGDQLEEAVKYYTKFIENTTEENQYPGLLNRGICNDKLERYLEALSDFDNALKSTNEQVKPYCLSCRARVKAKMDDQKGALKDYDEAVSHTAAFIEQIKPPKKMNDTSIPKSWTLTMDRYTPVGILLNGIKEDESGNSISAMQSFNKLLDEPVLFQQQIEDLQNQADTVSDPVILQTIILNINLAKIAILTVDKHKQAMKKFSANANLKIYYCSIYFKLEEIFTACKTVASKLVTPTGGKLAGYAEAVTLVGQAISILPCVGEPLSIIAQPIATLLERVDYKQQKNTMSRIANLGSTQELWDTSQRVAEALTEIYEPLLLQLIPLETELQPVDQAPPAKWSDCFTKPNWWVSKKPAVHVLKEEAYIKQAREIGEYAVALVLESLLQLDSVDEVKKQMDKNLINDENRRQNSNWIKVELKQMDENSTDEAPKQKYPISTDEKQEPLFQKLIDAVCIPKEQSERQNKNVKSLFRDRKILIKTENKKWTLDGFYHEPGITTKDKEVYVRPGSKSDVYPNRNGTKEEAERLQYILQK